MATTDTAPATGATAHADIGPIVERARAAFASGVTIPLEWREDVLRRLRRLLDERADDLVAALRADLGRPAVEAMAADVDFVAKDVDHILANLRHWARPRRVPTPVALLPAGSRVVRQPLGAACVIAPWNYPIQLSLMPVAAALAAGNTVVLKPSEVAPASAAALAELVAALGTDAVQVVLGGPAETTELLAQRFDKIFYTGNGTVGRVVMRAAAEHLTPVTLELGGKSPAIVTARANLEVTARRLVWAKFFNAGQTCVAPDYVLVERSVRPALVDALVSTIGEFYGPDPQRSDSYGRIVNDRHLQRLEKLLAAGTVVTGGTVDADDRYIAPTVVTGVTGDDPVMQEEIFGPILPVLEVGSVGEAVERVNAGDRPLALYVFSDDAEEADAIVAGTHSGGACVNAAVLHLSNPNLPFGGVGASGMGAYHGEAGFRAFSHERSVLSRSTKVDPPVLYPPYTPFKERLIKAAFALPDPRDLVARATARVLRR